MVVKKGREHCNSKFSPAAHPEAKKVFMVGMLQFFDIASVACCDCDDIGSLCIFGEFCKECGQFIFVKVLIDVEI